MARYMVWRTIGIVPVCQYTVCYRIKSRDMTFRQKFTIRLASIFKEQQDLAEHIQERQQKEEHYRYSDITQLFFFYKKYFFHITLNQLILMMILSFFTAKMQLNHKGTKKHHIYLLYIEKNITFASKSA